MSATSVGSSVEIDAADRVRLVFGFRQPLGLGVGGLVGQRVDGGALGIALAARQGVGMDRDEQRRRLVARDLHAVGERNEGVVRPGHDDAIFARFLDAVAQRQAKSQHQVLFHASSPPAWVPLSMPPWPGSITTTGRVSGGAAGLAAAGASPAQRRRWHRRSRAAVRDGFRARATGRRRCGRPLRARAPAAAAGRWPPPARRIWRSWPGPVRSNTIREPPGITRP